MSETAKKKKKPASPSGAKKKGAKGGSKPGTAKGDGVSKTAAAEEERKRLQAELGVAAAGRAAHEAAARALETQLASLHQRAAQEAATACDVLASQQRQQLQAQEASRALERQLEAARAEAAAAQQALDAALEAQRAAAEGYDGVGQESSELQRVQSRSRRQEERLAAQEGAIEALRLRLQHTEAALAAERATVAGLQVRAQGRSDLRFIRGAPFLVKVGRERLNSVPPPGGLRPGGALGAAGKQLVLALPASLHVLDMSTGAWWDGSSSTAGGGGGVESSQHEAGGRGGAPAAAAAATAAAAAMPRADVTGRGICSVGSKLLGFGGECEGRLLGSSSCTQFLLPDLQAWLPAPHPADRTAPQPPPRHGAALAYCPCSQAAFMYGGQCDAGAYLGDLWRLDLATMVWTRMDKLNASRLPTERTRPKTPAVHEPPPPAAGAALAVSRDGSRLWLMGGRLESGRCSNALHWFDLALNHWVAVEPQTWTIDSREQHVMACINRYLLVAGGLCHTASGQAIYRHDCAIYDPAVNSWDLISETAFEPAPASASQPRVVVSVAEPEPDCCSRRTTSSSSGGSSGKQARLTAAQRSSGGGSASGGGGAAPFLGAGTCTFADGKLLVLKAAHGGDASSELWTVELQLPSAIEQEQLLALQRTTTQKDLTLKEETVGAASVRLSWQAPTMNQEKLVSFKLMMTNSENRAREAYEGAEAGCDVMGLAPNSQYVFCVKALFDDATFLWSEPIMVTTKKAAASRSGMGGGATGGPPPHAR